MDKEKYTDRVLEILNWAYNDGYRDGKAQATADYGKAQGIAHCYGATPEEIETYGMELWGWCQCGRPIIGRWAGFINFCPWCGKIIEWQRDEEGKILIPLPEPWEGARP